MVSKDNINIVPPKVKLNLENVQSIQQIIESKDSQSSHLQSRSVAKERVNNDNVKIAKIALRDRSPPGSGGQSYLVPLVDQDCGRPLLSRGRGWATQLCALGGRGWKAAGPAT